MAEEEAKTVPAEETEAPKEEQRQQLLQSSNPNLEKIDRFIMTLKLLIWGLTLQLASCQSLFRSKHKPTKGRTHWKKLDLVSDLLGARSWHGLPNQNPFQDCARNSGIRTRRGLTSLGANSQSRLGRSVGRDQSFW
eukprot:143966-Amphidinium_carterae.1